MLKTYIVTASGFFGQQRDLMALEVRALNKKAALASARKRDNRDYFDRHDYLAGTLRWNVVEA